MVVGVVSLLIVRRIRLNLLLAGCELRIQVCLSGEVTIEPLS
jgi:hypothetical protein